MEIYTVLFMAFLFLIIFFYQFFKPLKELIIGKSNIPPIAVPFRETIYFGLYRDKFEAICERAEINFEELNMFMLPIGTLNAYAVETFRDRNNLIITEAAFNELKNDPELLEVMFAHELGHLNYMDSLWVTIKTEYMPVLMPLCIALFAFGITYAGDILLKNISPAWATIVGIIFAVLLFLFSLVIVLIILTSPIIPAWFSQLAEIRADLFSKRICGLENALRFMLLTHEGEENYLNSLTILGRLKFVYNKKDNAHPNAFFRAEQIRTIDEIGLSHRVAHYFRLLWWLLTLRGFYGRNIIV